MSSGVSAATGMERGVERILGLPRDVALADGAWHGIRTDGIEAILATLEAATEVRPRDEAELDESWKQIIPYLLVRDGERMFLMKRTRAGGDARLHERWSIGIGGHLGPDDASIAAGLRREFHEEVVADWDPQPRLLGLLNDDTTPVGRVHLGVVYTTETGGRPLSIRETDKLSGELVRPDIVRSGYERLESWSQLLFDLVEGTDRDR